MAQLEKMLAEDLEDDPPAVLRTGMEMQEKTEEEKRVFELEITSK
jgi:hypothetical protein